MRAFYKVSILKVLLKLEHFGMRGNLFKWIKYFLWMYIYGTNSYSDKCNVLSWSGRVLFWPLHYFLILCQN